MKTNSPLEHETAITVVNEQKNLIGIRRLVDRPIGLLTKAWKWLSQQQASRSNISRVKLENSISLGQKRFAAVIEVQGMRFLVGGGPSNVELLARLDGEAGFGKVLDQTKSKSNEVSFEEALEKKTAKSRTRQPKPEAQRTQKVATAKKKAVKKSAAKVSKSGKAKRAA